MALALITGASRGIGLELVRQYLADGWRVIATARRKEEVAMLAEMGAEAHKLDVTNVEAVAGMGWKLDGEELDVAILNAGSIRGDRVYAAGPLKRRTIVDMHPFGNVICEVAVTGRVLLQALEHGVRRLPDYANAGGFPQIAGFTMRVDLTHAPGSRVHDVRVNGTPLEPDRTYTLALPDFVLEGGDGYTMFAGSRVLIDQENGTPILDALQEMVAGREIAPRVEGRIVIEQ